jgi:hypothetical protein
MSHDATLYRANVNMLLLCALCGFWVLASPLVPNEFNPRTIAGMTVFLLAHQAFTMTFGTLGIALNGMSVRDERVTWESLRRVLQRRRDR